MEFIRSLIDEGIKKKYGEARRSNVIAFGAEIEASGKISEKDLKQIDDLVVAYTRGGYFKKMTEKNYNSSDKSVKENTAEDDFILFKCKAKSNNILLAFTNFGNVVRIPLESTSECRFRDKGIKFNAVFGELIKNERPIAFFAMDEESVPEGYLLFFTKDGLIKKTEWKEYAITKPYIQAIKLKEGDELIAVEQDMPETTIAYITKEGLILNAEKDDIPVQGRVAGGVKGIKLGDKDQIIFVSQVDEEGEFIIIADNSMYKRVVASDVEPMGRYRKGVKIVTLGAKDSVVYAGYVKEPYDLAVVDNFGIIFTVNTEDISVESRTAKGKTLKSVNKKRKPEKAYRI
jgi:DNA gyrase subunit A